jgi:hypothetical protein
MSAFAAIREAVENAVQTVAASLHARDDEQDKAIKALDDRLTALEKGTGTAAARKAAAAPKNRPA